MPARLEDAKLGTLYLSGACGIRHAVGVPDDDYAPAHGKGSFLCPHCRSVAQQDWEEFSMGQGRSTLTAITTCHVCEMHTCWWPTFNPSCGRVWAMVWPSADRFGPDPSPSMPAGVLAVYEEARSIAIASPRSAAALLRLALELLVRELLSDTKVKLNDGIGRLVKERGLDQRVQQSMDLLRLHGNDSVHPVTEILVDDQEQNVEGLMRLLNFLISQTIERDAELTRMWTAIPQTQRDAVAKRDGQ